MAGEGVTVEELHFLKNSLKKVRELGQEAIHRIKVPTDDDFGFMACIFLSRQLDHAESVLLLVPRRDAVLIARTMFDGLCQLLWAFRDPTKRAHQWRSFVFIHDWRLAKREIAEGKSINSETMRKLDDAVSKFGSIFIKKKGRISSDRYHKTWLCGKQLKELAEEVEGHELYEIAYGSMSDWEHWGHAGIGDSIHKQTGSVSDEEEILSFEALSHRASWQALLMAFQAVFQTLQVTDQHLLLGKSEALAEVYKSFQDGMNLYRPIT